MTSRAEYQKLWRETNREKVKAYNTLYYQNNKEKMKKYRATYYQDNRESILEKKQATIEDIEYQQGYRDCECGKTLKVSSFYQHKKNHCPKNRGKKPYINSLLLYKPICLETDL